MRSLTFPSHRYASSSVRLQGRHLAALARGQDAQTVEPDREAKSSGTRRPSRRTWPERPELHRHALRMADAVGARLTEAGLWGRTVSVKIRYADRTTITRSHTAAGVRCVPRTRSPTIAQALVDAVDLPQGVQADRGIRVGSRARRQGRRPPTELREFRGEGRGSGRPERHRRPGVAPGFQRRCPRSGPVTVRDR